MRSMHSQTVGYGDFYVSTQSNESFLIFFIILCSIVYVGALENFGFFLLLQNGANTPRYANTGTSVSASWIIGSDGQYKTNTNGNSSGINNIEMTPVETRSPSQSIDFRSPLPSSSSSSSSHIIINELNTTSNNNNNNNNGNTYGYDEYNFILSTLLRNNTINKERDLDPIISLYKASLLNNTSGNTNSSGNISSNNNISNNNNNNSGNDSSTDSISL
jgi:hypothetical protein